MQISENFPSRTQVGLWLSHTSSKLVKLHAQLDESIKDAENKFSEVVLSHWTRLKREFKSELLARANAGDQDAVLYAVKRQWISPAAKELAA